METTIMENQMEKKMENEMETREYYRWSPKHRPANACLSASLQEQPQTWQSSPWPQTIIMPAPKDCDTSSKAEVIVGPVAF